MTSFTADMWQNHQYHVPAVCDSHNTLFLTHLLPCAASVYECCCLLRVCVSPQTSCTQAGKIVKVVLNDQPDTNNDSQRHYSCLSRETVGSELTSADWRSRPLRCHRPNYLPKHECLHPHPAPSSLQVESRRSKT